MTDGVVSAVNIGARLFANIVDISSIMLDVFAVGSDDLYDIAFCSDALHIVCMSIAILEG